MSQARELRKIELRMRIGHRRERWRARLQRDTAEKSGAPADPPFPRSQSLRLLLSHPGAAVAGVAAVALIGPARLIRWGVWLLPLLRK
mgnify:CR=1 FL=1